MYGKTYFERVFRKYDPWGYKLGHFEVLKYRRQIDAIRQYRPAPSNILEIGCAEGLHTLMLAREFPSSQVLGIDISRLAIDRANKTCLGQVNICTMEGDIVSILRNNGLKPRSYDVILQSATLYYMFPGLIIHSSLKWYIERLVGLLRESGLFITSNESNIPTRWVMGVYYRLLKQRMVLVHESDHEDWNEFRKRSMGYDLKIFTAIK